MSDFEDITYTVEAGIATVMINRPDRLNALRPQSYEEIIRALDDAAWDESVGVIVLTGAGNKAFCIGGDNADGKSERRGRGTIGVPIEYIHTLLRDAAKPVIARVNGFAIGGGNVLATLCDLTIAADSAQFGQVGPKVGSVDPGFGTAYLSRLVGEKKARELWYLCRRYTAAEAVTMGLANIAVPDGELDAEVHRWCDELLQRSPMALAIAKRSFNADTEHLRGTALAGFQAVGLYYNTDEAKETGSAFKERRKPKFSGRKE
jgi:2-ketocyclohexanecarboxyl-CoA hydrolase